jgi:hypothetical protein
MFACSAFALLLAAASTLGEQPDPKVKAGAKLRLGSMGTAAAPVVQYTAHNRGNLQLAVANNGTFGTLGGSIPDPFTGEAIPSLVFPKASDIVYLWVSALWIGAVVNRDTLVSVGNEDWYVTQEFRPDVSPFGDFKYKSIDPNSPFYAKDARSEEDIICEYTDTVTDPNVVQMDPDDVPMRPHRPLYVKATQCSMAWSYAYARDFILVDYQVKNIGHEQLKGVYMGIYVDGDVWHVSRNDPSGWNDDIVGFYREHPAPEGCGFIDTINVAYTADNDGDPVGGAWDYRSALGTVGVRVVRTPSRELKYSFNWWIINYGDPAQDFGPRQSGTATDPFRRLGDRLGTPAGDRNRYYVMRHPEFDYDLLYTAVDHVGWEPKPGNADEIARGYDCRYLLSFGPFDISPGEDLPITFAWVAGANFHRRPNDFAQLCDPQHPDQFYNALDFSKLAATSRWASWVYDNPGVDTDGDGFAGKERVCVLDSVLVRVDTVEEDGEIRIIRVFEPTRTETYYYEGDGVPDFRAAGPPPAPRSRLVPENGKLTVRWNGYYSETTRDIFSRIVDFEGYRVYMGRDERLTSLSLLASYDTEDYNRYVYRETSPGTYGWSLDEIPFTVDSLRTLFGDPDFEPLLYTRLNPFNREGKTYAFDKQDYNTSDLGNPVGIHRAYPDAVNPGNDSSKWQEDDLTAEHGRPLPKYYEYEFVIDNLLPTVEYYVAVTCFDFGSPTAGLLALETDPTNNEVIEYPQTPSDTVSKYGLDVYVYPNPYRSDGAYTARGFENRDRTLAEDRARRIHFANLPRVCKIRIFSLDGDLVREIDHNFPTGGPTSQHDTWDLITRNTQAAVSGLYYFVVESPERTQIGKFVIIR